MTTQTLPKVIGGDIPVVIAEQRNGPWLPRLNSREGLSILQSSFRELVLLNGGHQCLIRVAQGKESQHFYFAGRDSDPESVPFITRVAQPAYTALQHGGESAFFDALTPDIIKECQRFFPDSVRRQGDMWVAKIATSWEGIEPFIRVVFAPTTEKPVDVVAKSILSTRHTCTGKSWIFRVHRTTERTVIFKRKTKKAPLKRIAMRSREVGSTELVLMQGILKAPDHTAVDASDGVYVVARTPHLLPTPAWIGHSA